MAQNSYKLPSDVRLTLINIVKGYDRRAQLIKEKEEEICSVGGGSKYETYIVASGEERRTFLPFGKGGTSSPVENQAERLEGYHNSFDYRCNKAIDDALNELSLEKYKNAQIIKNGILNSIKNYRNYPFSQTMIDEISEKTFYGLRIKFLYILAKKLNFL